MKKVSIFLLAFSCLALTASAWAAGGDGETLFKSRCGACHMRGGAAAPVNPGDKAGRVWVKYFKRDRHPVEIKATEAEMELIIEFLEKHAADSDQPRMLAIPQ
ncbi:MAG: cytochrome c [Desulfurivibrionaceae bacterium]